jgi:hypothetical protein
MTARTEIRTRPPVGVTAPSEWPAQVSGRRFSPRLVDQLVVAAVALIANGWLVLNDGVYWDDWLLYTQLTKGEWSTVQSTAQQAGGIPTYLYVWWAAAFAPPAAVGFKVVSLALLVGAALLIYRICSSSGFCSRTESVLIASVAATFPADHTHVLLITIPYLVYWTLFLAGVLLLLLSARRGGASKAALRVAADLAFFISFGLNSLLVLYLGVLVIYAISLHAAHRLAGARTIPRQLLAHVDLLVLPLVFWAVYRLWFAPNGIYGYYHQFDLSSVSITASLGGFWSASVVSQFADAIAALSVFPMLWLVVIAMVQRFWRAQPEARESLRPRLAMFVFGIFLFILAILPYNVVGLIPDAHGWSSRHAMLLSLPVALVVISGTRLLFRGGHGSVTALGAAVVLTLVTGFVLDGASTYVGWEARWVKDQSVIANLRADASSARYSVYWINDSYPKGGDPSYRFYEWASILGRAYGGESRVGLDVTSTPTSFLSTGVPYFNGAYNLGHFDPQGCQADVTIKPGPGARTDPVLVARYVYYSLFDRNALRQWLPTVTRVTVAPLQSGGSSRCSAA